MKEPKSYGHALLECIKAVRKPAVQPTKVVPDKKKRTKTDPVGRKAKHKR